MNCDDEDLLDIITRQRLTIYHQERRIEALEKSLSQATNPTMTNDLVNQLFNQLQTSNELMALKAKCERLETENAHFKAEVERLTAFTTRTITPNEELQAQVERLDTLCKQVMAQHSDISCENIMLRKAGDAMLLALNKRDDIFDNSDKDKAISDWNAAKEGKQS